MPSIAPRLRADILVAASIFLLALAIFLPSLGNDFVNLDDQLYVYGNSLVKGGLTPAGVLRAFTGPECNFYHPFTMLSLMLDHELWGLEPAGFRLTNILLHAATSALLFLTLHAITRARWQSAFVASVFALHPLRVESVAWVAERKDVLSAFFYILTIAAYAWYARRPLHLGRYLAVVAVFIAGLLCKTTLVTIPALLLLLDYWPLRREARPARLILEKLPLVVLAILATILAIFAQKAGVLPYDDYPLGSRLQNALHSYVLYLGQTLVPTDLSPYYPFSETALAPGRIVLCALLLAGISAAALLLRRRNPYFAVGWCWYLGVLFPMVGIVQVGTFSHADRFTYLPQIGLLIILAWGSADLTRSWKFRRPLLTILAATILLSCALLTTRQIRFWRDSETLFRQALAVTTANDLAHSNLAVAILEPRIKGVYRPLAVPPARRAEAIGHLREAARLQPDHPDTHLNLGLQLALTDTPAAHAEAIEHLEIALRTMGFHARAHFLLGVLLVEKGRVEEGQHHLEEAVRLDPTDLAARNNLASRYRAQGRLDDAIAQYEAAIRQAPDYADAHNNLGIALYQSGRKAEAIRAFQAALRCDPTNPRTQQNLRAAQQ